MPVKQTPANFSTANKFRIKRLALAIQTASYKTNLGHYGAAAALAFSPAAVAQQTVDIPAQDLAGGLKALGKQTGLQIIYDANLIAGKQSPAIKGALTSEEVLTQLLNGSGIQFTISGNAATLLDPNSINNNVMTLDPVQVESSAEARFGDAPVEPGGFKAEYQTTGTKMALPLRETPQAISVVTRDSLDARQVKDLATAVELAPGLSNSSRISGPGAFAGFGRFKQRFVTRGQVADVRTDGFVTATPSGGVDIAAYERIEVVKGPAGFYGQGSLGGFINLVRKKPQADFATDISIQAGSFDTYRAETNITGALTEQENLRGQLTVAYDNAGAFVKDVESEQFFLTPSLEWIVSDKTRVLLQTLYQKDKYDPNIGVSLTLEGNQFKLFKNESLSSRSKLQGVTGEKSEEETIQSAITIDHKLSDKWLASLLLNHTKRKQRYINNNYATAYYGYIYIYGEKDNRDVDTWAGELRLKGEFDTFGQTHKLLLGLEKNERNEDTVLGEAGGSIIGSVYNFGGYLPRSLSILEKNIPTTLTEVELIKNKALYGQLVLSLHERTKLLIGGRYDSTYQYLKNSSNNDGKKRSHALTTRLGITQEITNNISAYAIYAESFSPVLAKARNGILAPETGEGYELGLKTEWFNNKLGANLTVYRQELDNRPISDPTNTRREDFNVSSGQHRTEGVEFEITGSPYPGLTIATAASWSDNEFTEQGDPNKGLSIDGSVDQQYSLYVNYELQAGTLRGLGIGATLVSADERQFIISGKQIYLEGYERLDLNLSYNGLPNWDISFLVRNITDEKYIESASHVLSIANYFGAPRSALLKATYHFD